jgi:hypothetical protein
MKLTRSDYFAVEQKCMERIMCHAKEYGGHLGDIEAIQKQLNKAAQGIVTRNKLKADEEAAKKAALDKELGRS